jgi:hypothetical protein
MLLILTVRDSNRSSLIVNEVFIRGIVSVIAKLERYLLI